MSSPFDLPEERLATTTETGARVKLYPADVQGRYRKARTIVGYALILFFLSLPWIKIHGSPLLLLDIVHRHFSIFGFQFRGEDGPIIFFVLGLFILTIATVTSLWGRVWCGWACPQTVFIDGVYRRIERWVEGSAHSRRLLDKQPWTGDKIRKKATKILLYLAASLVITHSFLAVFVGGDQLLSMIQMSPLHNPGPAIMILLSTLFITAEFGIFREQFCIIACPYGRLQSVLQDDRSTVVLYDSKRGEPRKSDRNSKAPSGDCINCYRCVQVCPTGVDIRRGLQLECIQCTACIDACDAVMEKQGLPKGLIRYDAIDTAAGKRNPFFKIRTVIYLSILSVFFAGLIYAVSHRQPLRVEVIRGTMPFQISEDHIVTNHFRLHVYNRKTETATFKIRILPETQGLSWVIPQPLLVDGGEQGIFDLFIRFPESEIPPLQIKIDATTHDDVFSVTSDPFRVVNPAEFGSSE